MSDLITTWAHTARQNQYHQDPSHQQAISHIAACLHGHLPVAAAVEAIMAVYPNPRGNSSVFFDAIHELAHISEHAEKLAEMRMQFAKPPTADEAEYPRRNWTEWFDFGWAFWEHEIEPILMTQEEVDDGDSGVLMSEGYDHQRHRRAVCQFIAWTLVKAPRVQEWPSMEQAAEACLEKFLEFRLEPGEARLRLPHAAIFFRVAGREVLRLCEVTHRCEERRVLPHVTPDFGEWKESQGYSVERWEFWKERWRMFEELLVPDGLGDVVQEALKCMESAEKVVWVEQEEVVVEHRATVGKSEREKTQRTSAKCVIS